MTDTAMQWMSLIKLIGVAILFYVIWCAASDHDKLHEKLEKRIKQLEDKEKKDK